MRHTRPLLGQWQSFPNNFRILVTEAGGKHSASQLGPPGGLYPKNGPGNITVTWELVTKADSRAPPAPRTTE